MIQTKRLFLIPATLPMLESIVDENWPQLSILLGGVDFADQWYHFPEAYLWMRDYMRDQPVDANWWSYLIIHQTDACVIGTCGYKGAPSLDGKVEIGYEIAPRYQGNGYATEAAKGLCDLAFSFEAVHMVVANTLAEENPSVRLLRTLGFRFSGEHIDLEDGKIWSWELPRSGHARA
jgi:ribosomal-protein-alanine N-acetyltransferase